MPDALTFNFDPNDRAKVSFDVAVGADRTTGLLVGPREIYGTVDISATARLVFSVFLGRGRLETFSKQMRRARRRALRAWARNQHRRPRSTE